MNLESLNSQMAALRDGDEAVGSALTELNSRLERWFGAMRDGQDAVAGAWRHLIELREAAGAAIAALPADETPAVETEKPVLAEETPVVAESAMTEESPAVAAESLPEASAEEEADTVVPSEVTDESDANSAAGATVEVESESRQPEGESPRGMFQKARTEPSAPVGAVDDSDGRAQPGSQEDDEALLATLDEETLAAIRVKRRLGGTRRSVRELLEEIRAEKPAVKDKPQQRKSWWR